MRRKSLFWVACFVGILVLFWIMLRIRDANADWGILGKISRIPNFDKLGHFFMMGSLAFCTVSAIRCWFPQAGWKLTLKILCLFTLASGLEECSQAYSPNRTVSLADFAASTAGISFFGWLSHRKQ